MKIQKLISLIISLIIAAKLNANEVNSASEENQDHNSSHFVTISEKKPFHLISDQDASIGEAFNFDKSKWKIKYLESNDSELFHCIPEFIYDSEENVSLSQKIDYNKGKDAVGLGDHFFVLKKGENRFTKSCWSKNPLTQESCDKLKARGEMSVDEFEELWKSDGNFSKGNTFYNTKNDQFFIHIPMIDYPFEGIPKQEIQKEFDESDNDYINDVNEYFNSFKNTANDLTISDETIYRNGPKHYKEETEELKVKVNTFCEKKNINGGNQFL